MMFEVEERARDLLMSVALLRPFRLRRGFREEIRAVPTSRCSEAVLFKITDWVTESLAAGAMLHAQLEIESSLRKSSSLLY